MDELFSFLVDELCYRVGFRALKIITGGRFQGKSSYWYGLLILLGGLIIFGPLIGLLAWALMR